MAINKITAPSSIPATVADYQAQNSHLMAFINQINSQAFILSDPNGTVAPTIKQGAYISHGGSLYIVDTADATISGTPSDGTVYIRVSGTDTLTAEYITDISSYAWNSAYNAMISGSYTLLPYMLIKSGTSYTKYRFEQHKQAFGNAIIDGHDIDSELDTLNGRVNQGVKTTDSPTFASVNTGQGANEVYKISRETIDFGAMTSNLDKYISAFSSNEIRFVSVTGYIVPSDDPRPIASLFLPSGYSYDVLGRMEKDYTSNIGILNGGAEIFSRVGSTTSNTYLTASFIIKRTT
jgi:hypothetical protein